MNDQSTRNGLREELKERFLEDVFLNLEIFP